MLIQHTMHLESGIFAATNYTKQHKMPQHGEGLSFTTSHKIPCTWRVGLSFTTHAARLETSHTRRRLTRKDREAERLETSHTRRRLTEGQGIRSRTFRDFAYTRRLTQKWSTSTHTKHFTTTHLTLTSRLETSLANAVLH